MDTAKKLKDIRKERSLTQVQAATLLGIPLRTYCRYESDDKNHHCFKYNQMVAVLLDLTKIDKEHGILSLQSINRGVNEALSRTSVEFCYLFGSYAKGNATEKSDIDLLVAGCPGDICYYEILEKLESSLKKKIDLVRIETAVQNIELMKEIFKDGIEIYR